MSKIKLSLLIVLACCQSLISQESYVFDEVLYSGPMGSGRGGRTAVYTDPIMSDLIDGTLTTPKQKNISGNDREDDTTRWRSIEMDDKGMFQLERVFGGYIYLRYESDKEEVVILKTNGNSDVIVNGVLRPGDYYGKGWSILPVQLKIGSNEFWYKVGRGRNRTVTLEKPKQPVFLSVIDPTLPDLLTDENDEKWAAIRIVNSTNDTLSNLRIVSEVTGKLSTTELKETVTPMTTRKAAFKVWDAAQTEGVQPVGVSLYIDGQLVDKVDLELEVKERVKNFRRTFVSGIDGSVQYYGVREGQAESGRKPAMFLSVHGAGVKAIRQAGSYQNKDWGHVIAPTNRREFGFDWEDWGRMDAMEVLADAERAYGTDPERTYLTGHSMGGHGTWYLGATYPDRWAAIAPMAGWRSFFSYTRTPVYKEPSSMEAMLNRAANPSRTMEMSRNYLHHGVFIEHGDADKSVPVREARAMREHLATFHPSMRYHEEPGGGHWYGVDHQRAFDFFNDHQKKDIRDLDVLEFRISNPGISSTCRYITLYQQVHSYEYCGVVAKQTIRSRRQRRNDEDVTERTIDIATENLKTFRVDLAHCMHLQKLELRVDGQPIPNLPWPARDHVWLKKEAGQWAVIEQPQNSFEKNPERYGGFKEAFNHRVVFVYSTGGEPAENEWSYNKARYDAETFYYRGNGSIEIIADSEFELEKYNDRSVILFGNATTNKAWPQLLDQSPVQVKRDVLQIGDRNFRGTEFGIYMVRPRRDSAIASVGVVAGTGLPGMNTVSPNRYFIAGTGFPDLLVLTPETFSKGVEGVVAAGYFGNDWSVKSGDIEFQNGRRESKSRER